MKTFALIFLLSSIVAAQKADPPTYASVRTVPTISLEHSAEYFAAAAEVNALSGQLQQAQTKFDAIKNKVIADCGEGFVPNLSIASKPRCDPHHDSEPLVEKPKEDKKEVKK